MRLCGDLAKSLCPAGASATSAVTARALKGCPLLSVPAGPLAAQQPPAPRFSPPVRGLPALQEPGGLLHATLLHAGLLLSDVPAWQPGRLLTGRRTCLCLGCRGRVRQHFNSVSYLMMWTCKPACCTDSGFCFEMGPVLRSRGVEQGQASCAESFKPTAMVLQRRSCTVGAPGVDPALWPGIRCRLGGL